MMAAVLESTTDDRGPVITFYSYKGGTGRSMALANVACLLSKRKGSRGVLMIDWDLEAPGLHRFFGDLLPANVPGEQVWESRPGLIDLFYDLNAAMDKADQERTSDKLSKQAADQVIKSVDFAKYVLPMKIEGLWLLKAGTFNSEYSSRVGQFHWEAFYKRRPWLFRSLADHLADSYSFVLIDSRTGLNDTSGICTSLMPEKLVLVFTPSLQSISGVLETVHKVTNYRRSSPDVRKLIIYPLPSRIEISENKLREDWQLGNHEEDIDGWQPMFERALVDAYGLTSCDLTPYFSKVQIRQSSSFAYGEQIAVLNERSSDSLSLSATYVEFVQWLTQSRWPWDAPPSTTSKDVSSELAVAQAEGFYNRVSEYQQAWTKQVLLRLITIPPLTDEPVAIREHVDRLPLEKEERVFVDTLEQNRIITRVRQDQAGNAEAIELANPAALLQGWSRLRTWISEERSFIEWLRRMRASGEEWTKTRDSSVLLRGKKIKEAVAWLGSRQAYLNSFEIDYINASLRRRRSLGIVAIVASILLAAGALLAARYLYHQWTAKQLVDKIGSASDGATAEALANQLEQTVGSKDPSVAAGFVAAGDLYDKAKDTVAAESDYKKALNLYTSMTEDHELSKAAILNQLGKLEESNSTKQAGIDYSAALKIYEAKAPNDPGAATALVGLANTVPPSPKNLPVIRDYLTRAVAIYKLQKPQSNAAGLSEALGRLGRIYSLSSDYIKAVDAYQQAIDAYQQAMANSSGADPSRLLNLYYNLARAADLARNPDITESGYRGAIDVYENKVRTPDDPLTRFYYTQALIGIFSLLRDHGRKREAAEFEQKLQKLRSFDSRRPNEGGQILR